jgi:hypothetical protein
MSGRGGGWRKTQNVPSWRGKRGRLAAAKVWRRTRLEAISNMAREGGFDQRLFDDVGVLLVVVVVCRGVGLSGVYGTPIRQSRVANFVRPHNIQIE